MTMDDPVKRTRLRLAEISVDGDQLVELRGLLINNIETYLRQLDLGNLTALELVVEAMIRSGTAWAAEAGLRQLLVETRPQDRGPVDSLLQRVIYEKETPSDEFLAALEELSGESLDREYRRRVVRQDIAWGGRTLTLDTGKVARQADGAVMATLGETVVLCAVTVAKSVNDRQDFFPLTVHYQEKYSAAGRIPGGFFKRERGASEKETLISRLIDRPIRPLFPKGFRNEVNVVAQVLSYDGENEPDILAMVAASAALAISGVPVKKHIGAVRVGYLNGEYVLNPTDEQVAEGDLDLVVAATDSAVIMVESQANELSEEVMLGAVLFAHDACRVVTAGISEFQDRVGVEPWDRPAETKHAQAAFKLRERLGREVTSAYQITDKSARTSALAVAREKAHVLFEDGSPREKSFVGELFKALEAQIVRTAILKEGKRIDGRTTTQIRPIVAETGFLPRAHGSALFTRGETQTIATCTLGTKNAEQMVDGLNGLRYERFMLHYNFPPYSVGEVGRFGAPSRRDVGHGKLAWCALHAVLPSKDDFPYMIRLTSDITESNGSSSMASVCGGSLAMMDAGVPIKRPVAGIAMGLILDGNHFAILSDIMGDEDHLGDMDFKVAGTSEGITTMQMDVKIAGITHEIFEAALNQAKEGRAHILAEMAKAVYHTREELSAHAPRIERLSIDKLKIRDVIGTGGKVIREIVAITGAKVDIDDEGVIQVSSSDKAQIEAAINWIKAIVEEPEVGKIYNGKVVNILDFGAFVNFMGGKDGLVHISEINSERVDRISDVLSEGQKVMVKVLEVNPRGKVRLSMRVVDQETGEELEDTRPAREPRERDRGIRGDRGSRRDEERGPRRDRGGRGPRRERAQDKEEDRVASDFTPAFLTTTVGDD